MNLALLFSFGFISPILEIHLLSFHVDQTYVALCFVLQTASYSFFALAGARLFQGLDERTTMGLGVCVIGVAYLMMAPWEMIFPRQLWIVLLSLPVMGLGEAMIYSKIYAVPSFPHMLRVAVEDYGYERDDVLIDGLSALSNIACNAGEVVGPLFSGIVAGKIGFGGSSAVVAFGCFGYAAVYLLGSGLLAKWTSRKKINAISLKLIMPEEITYT